MNRKKQRLKNKNTELKLRKRGLKTLFLIYPITKFMNINGQEVKGEVIDWDSYYSEVEKIYLSSDNPDEWVAKEKEYEKNFILIKIK